MRIGLTYDLQTDPLDERQAEFDPPRTIEALCGALEALGHEVVKLGSARSVLAARSTLCRMDLVFNIAEGSQGRCREAWVPSVLEAWRIPYVGSGPTALALGLDKVASKKLAVASGVPTPPWVAVNHPDDCPTTLPFDGPAIVKPRYEGSGMGIDEEALVPDRQGVTARAQALFARWHEPILVEQFMPHGELTVCVIGNNPPIAYPAIQRPIDRRTRLSYHVLKRPEPGSWLTPLQLDEALDAEARRLALAMFMAVGCRDVARVDLRVDDAGHPWFLEINPLPSFDPEGSLGLLAEYLGLTYTDLIGRILDAARCRLAGSPRPLEAARLRDGRS